MASIEFITKRIEGKKKEIQKLESKLSRIRKAEASNWEINPYYYSDSDLKWAEHDLSKAREALLKYEADYAVAMEKENSRNVTAIIEFLNAWADKVYKHYEASLPKYVEALKQYYKDLNDCGSGCKTRWEQYWSIKKQFSSAWGWYQSYAEYKSNNGYIFNGEKLMKELEQDKKEKYDDIIERANEICGQITDASALSVGDKGELNGIVYGTRGNARIETIGAGGYNIQCYHFRTLIHKI